MSRGKARTLPVHVAAHHPAFASLCGLCRQEVRMILAAMCAVLERGALPCGVEAHLVGDAAISQANSRYMGCVGPTNVLSFPGDAAMPGILLLSVDTVRRVFLLYGQAPYAHTIRLLAHGMGHLAHFEHGPAMDALCGQCAAAAIKALGG